MSCSWTDKKDASGLMTEHTLLAPVSSNVRAASFPMALGFFTQIIQFKPFWLADIQLQINGWSYKKLLLMSSLCLKTMIRAVGSREEMEE